VENNRKKRISLAEVRFFLYLCAQIALRMPKWQNSYSGKVFVGKR
jgi:hypothetical protein